MGLGLTEKNDNNTARGCRRMGERGLEMTGITTSWVLRQTEMSIRRCLAMPGDAFSDEPFLRSDTIPRPA